jgi:surfactin synthase thioesterase subunit
LLLCASSGGPPATLHLSARRRLGDLLPAVDDRAGARSRQYTGLVDKLTEVFRPRLSRPYALYGHSMGAIVAYELVQRRRALGAPSPGGAGGLGAGCPAHVRDEGNHQRDDAGLIREVLSLGGFR